MKSLRTLIVLAALSGVATLACAVRVAAADLVLTDTLTITSDTTFDSVAVRAGGRLTANARITVLGSMVIDSGGLVTHSVRWLSGLVLEVTGTLHVRSGGSIDLTAKGLRGGQNGSLFGNDGESYDSLGQIVAGAKGGVGGNNSGAGASYGGYGANSDGVTGLPYGWLEDAGYLGAGGGGTTNGARPGGHGGGRATITAAAVIVDGAIRANGGVGVGGNPQSGGGSGGSIRMTVGALSGSGTIECIGGIGVNSYPTPSGSGSGGRIAIYYGTNSLAASRFTARGGGNVRPGSAGTIYLKDQAATYGDLIVDNGNIATSLFTPFMTQVSRLRSVVVRSVGRLLIDSAQTLPITNPAGWDLSVESGSLVELVRQSAFDAVTMRVNGATLNTHISLGFADGAALELSGAGTINVTDSTILSLGYFTPANLKSGTLNISAGCRLEVATNTVTVGTGVTLFKDGTFGVSDQLADLTIDSGGVVTHSVRWLAGLELEVTGTLQVKAGGAIDLTAKGLRGGQNGSVFGNDGESYDSLGQIVAGAHGGLGGNNSGAGASYGGYGANSDNVTGLPYGRLEDAGYLGAGGGGTTNGPHAGGHGGGRATITAAAVIVDGAIRANGGAGVGGNPQSGGGSGGSIRMTVGALSGSGTIEAIGGIGVNSYPTPSGSGGGGRIAIFYQSNTLASTRFTARGGGNVRPGSAGTIYLKDNAATYGDLIIDNGNIATTLFTPFMTQVSRLQSVVVRSVGRLVIDSAQTLPITNPAGWDLSVESGSLVELARQSALDAVTMRVNGATLNAHISLGFADGADLELSGAGTINVTDSAVMSLGYFTPSNLKSGTLNITTGCRLDVATNTVTVGTGVTLIKDGTFGVADQLTDLTIDSGGVVTHSVRWLAGLELEVTGTLQVKAGGSIDLTAKGLRGGQNGSVFGNDGESYDSLGQIVVGAHGGVGGNNSGAGASYGGYGANSDGVTGLPYGRLEDAGYLGAGGGGTTNGPRAGGHGGGRATITAAAVIVDGAIRANGGAGVGGNPQSGGGSGGSIRMTVGALSGSGTIEAIGGIGVNSFPTPSGSGGGGRIAIFYQSNTLASTRLTARGGGNVRPGSAGTIYLKDQAATYGDLIIDNGNVASTLNSLLLTDLPQFEMLTVTKCGTVRLPSSPRVFWDTAFVGSGGRLAAQGALHLTGGWTVLASGTIDADSAIYLDSGTVSGSGSLLANVVVNAGELRVGDSLRITDSIYLNGGRLTGKGTLRGNVVNSATVSPGSSYAILTIDGSYVQSPTGSLDLQFRGTVPGTDHDRLRILGGAWLDGALVLTFDSNYVPDVDTRLDFLRFDSLGGDFSSVSGLDSTLSLVRIDTSLVLAAGADFVSKSTADKVILVSPAGDIPYKVYLRDSQGQPVGASSNLWLDFTKVQPVSQCGNEQFWPIIFPDAPTDADGGATFWIKAGGCTTDSAAVMTSHGLIARVPVRFLDRDGGLLVTARDFQGDECNDYNLDGVVDAADWAILEPHIGTNCLDDPSNYVLLDVFTDPGPHDIFQGDTIQVCGQLSSTANEPIEIDSALFMTANWGIARSWTTFARADHLTLDGRAATTIRRNFVIPESHHGCFKVRVYPRFAAGPIRATSRSTIVDPLATSLSGLYFEEVTASQIMQTLKVRYDLPVSFIPSRHEKPLTFGVFEGTLKELMLSVAARDRSYTFEVIDGYPVLHASDPAWDAVVTGVDITSLPRFDAATQYVEMASRRVPGLSDLVPPSMIGSPRATAYADTVSLSHSGRVVDHLVQLMGHDPTMSFSIAKAASGLPMLCLEQRQMPNATAAWCPECRPTAINYANVENTDCPDPAYCGAAITYDITNVTTECCSAAPCDCEGGRLTEVVTNDHGCSPQNVRPGSGCPIGAFGAMPDCNDLYRVCIPPREWPADSCTETISQKLYVCGRLVQTVTITFTLRRTGDGCTGSAPVRIPDPPKPPPPCDSVFSKDRQMNVDALKRTQPGDWALRAAGVTHFDIPIGTEAGDSLYLFRLVFLPDGWSFSVSDSGWIQLPDTLGIDVTHPDQIPDKDTGRIVFYAYNNRDLFAGSAEIRVYNPDAVVAVSDSSGTHLPTSFRLAQNYPNPFNPATTIEYSLPEACNVTLEVFNVLGRWVTTLVRETKPAGTYRVDWNGLDKAGNPVPTGLYLYRIHAGLAVETKKMLLLK